MAATMGTLPVLESGDRLTREEFHRRYSARPDIHKAELVNGVVYLTWRVRSEEHGKPHGVVAGWLGAYVALNPDLGCGLSTTVFLTDDSEAQPDCLLFRQPPAGYAVRHTEDDFLEGAPEMVVEVAASSASYDLHDKLRAYRRNGVREYIVWRTLDGALDWFRLQEGEYVRVEPDTNGMLESSVFPGLRLSVPALLARDRAGVLAALGEPA